MPNKGLTAGTMSLVHLEIDRLTSRVTNIAPHLSLPFTIPCFPGPAHMSQVRALLDLTVFVVEARSVCCVASADGFQPVQCVDANASNCVWHQACWKLEANCYLCIGPWSDLPGSAAKP